MWSLRPQISVLNQTTNKVKKSQLERLTETDFWRQESRATELLVLTETQKLAHSRLLWLKNFPKASLNASSLNKIWSELPQVSLAERKSLSLQHLLPFWWEEPTKSELQVLVVAISNWLVLTQESTLDRTDQVKWLFRTSLSSEPYQTELYSFLATESQLKKQSNSQPTTTMDQSSSGLLVLMSPFSSKMTSTSKSEKVRLL